MKASKSKAVSSSMTRAARELASVTSRDVTAPRGTKRAKLTDVSAPKPAEPSAVVATLPAEGLTRALDMIRNFAGALSGVEFANVSLAAELASMGWTSDLIKDKLDNGKENTSAKENKRVVNAACADGIMLRRAARIEEMADGPAKKEAQEAHTAECAAYLAKDVKGMNDAQKAMRMNLMNSANAAMRRVFGAMEKRESTEALLVLSVKDRAKEEKAREKAAARKQHEGRIAAAKKLSVRDLVATLASAIEEDEKPDYDHNAVNELVAELIDLLGTSKK
jgi:hypothetical protein